ncbi:MAG: hypothetical protein GQ550_04035 [Gammaproteobacteria bacterium]|nr:hypothetical protein [Gammaproteobacteria bacterium]
MKADSDGMNRGSPVRKLPARKLLVAIVAGALFLPNTAFTLGLGEIEVNSSLNQKLKADIELLSATEENAESIIVKLASRKEFTRAGLDRPYLLNDLRFKSEVIDGVPHISVTSASPIREPFLNFLVEIDWPNGHLIREYTILLDPPVFMTQPASVTSAPAQRDEAFRPSSGGSTNVVPVVTPGITAAPRPAAAGIAPAPQAATQPVAAPVKPAFVPAPYVQQQTSINQQPGTYRIKTGDTAWSLANAMMPDQSITVEQMMIAMLRANPESFIDENINGLKRGYILRVPDYDQIVSINQEDARALVREQAALWRQYQQTHAGGQPTSAMSTDEMGGASYTEDGAVITGEEDDAYLEIVSAGAGSSTMSSKDPTQMSSQELRAELALARERVETERVEKEALQQRVNTLEQNVDKMKGLLSIEDDELSDIQALGTPAEGVPSEGEMLEADIVEDAEAEMEESIAETDDLLAEQNLDDAIKEEVAASDELTEEEAEAAIYLDETAADGEAADMLEGVDSIPDQAVAVDDVAQQPQIVTQPPADPLSKLLSDPMLLAAAGGGLLLILAVIGLIIKRRKAAAEAETVPFGLDADDDLESLAEEVAAEKVKDEVEVEVESLAGDADQVDADAEETAINDFASDSTMVQDEAEDTIIAEEDSAVAADDDEPRDDVLAEADVYLAYGIYQQAEELLAQAITDNPDRDDYRVKLAETHYASKNAEAFVEVATEIKNRAADEITPAWKKVMVMGQDLCADNDLFQGSMVGGLDVDALAPKAPEMDFDLGMDDAGGASPDLDLSLDDQPLELPDMEASNDEGSSDEGEPEEDEITAEPAGEIEFDLSDMGAEDETSSEPAGGIEFDLSDTGAVEEAPAAENDFSLDIDAAELDIDIQEETDEPAVSESDEVHDVGDIDIDFGLDDDKPASAESVDDVEIAIDLTEEADALDLDLDDSGAATEEAAPAPASDLADDDDFDLSSLDDVDEVSTKLDLARAYLDMGDSEGTRGILEEVIAEGNDEQKQEANELMAKLD